MTIVVKKYGRWDESCNWQLDSSTEKEMTEESFRQFAEYGGFTKSRYGYYAVSEDKHRMTVVEPR